MTRFGSMLLLDTIKLYRILKILIIIQVFKIKTFTLQSSINILSTINEGKTWWFALDEGPPSTQVQRKQRRGKI